LIIIRRDIEKFAPYGWKNTEASEPDANRLQNDHFKNLKNQLAKVESRRYNPTAGVMEKRHGVGAFNHDALILLVAVMQAHRGERAG